MALDGRGRGSAPTIGHNRQSGHTRSLVVCVVVSLALFTASSRMGSDGPIAAVRGAFQTVTMPVRYLGAAVTAPFQGIGNVFANLTADQATLSELQQENEELQARNVELEEALKTTERMRALLDLQSSYDLQSTAARIISGSTDSWSTTVTIDKGTSSGLAAGMPVTGSAGVIGQIVECGPTSATVRLLSDESSSVSAMVQSSRAQGMLTGSASGQVSLTLVSTTQQVAVGDVVVTSGLGGVYPKGLPLGEVASVESAPGSLYYTIVVDLYVSVESNEEVLVITSLTEAQQATAEDFAEADSQETPVVTDEGQGQDEGAGTTGATE